MINRFLDAIIPQHEFRVYFLTTLRITTLFIDTTATYLNFL